MFNGVESNNLRIKVIAKPKFKAWRCETDISMKNAVCSHLISNCTLWQAVSMIKVLGVFAEHWLEELIQYGSPSKL